jgi:hypothetical protein
MNKVLSLYYLIPVKICSCESHQKYICFRVVVSFGTIVDGAVGLPNSLSQSVAFW